MADISRYIEKINKAKYGEEVRGSISDALTAMNTETIAAEAWATGGTGGTPGPDNNARYYAEQAEAVAESIPPDYTELSDDVETLKANAVDTPTGFVRLAYMQSDGDATLVTDKKLTESSRIVCVFARNTEESYESTQFIFGARSTTTLKAFAFGFTPNGYAKIQYGTDQDVNVGQHLLSDTSFHTVDFNGSSVYVDGVLIWTGTVTDFTTPFSCQIFGCMGYGSTIYRGACKIMSLKIYDDGETLSRDYIPVRRISDDEEGMYDLVNETFARYSETSVGTLIPGEPKNLIELTESVNDLQVSSEHLDLRVTELEANDARQDFRLDIVEEILPSLTLSGNPVTFENSIQNIYFRELRIPFRAVQAGGGNPMPDNYRAISQPFSVAFYLSGSDTSDPTELSFDLSSAPQGFLYAGEIDVATGKVYARNAIRIFTGTESDSTFAKGSLTIHDDWYVAQTDGYTFGKTSTWLTEEELTEYDCRCTVLPTVRGNTWTDYGYGIYIGRTAVCQPRLIFPLSAGINTKSALKTWLAEMYNAGTPCAITYPLKEPIEYSLPFQQVSVLVGTNNVWVDDDRNLTITIPNSVNEVAKEIVDEAIEESGINGVKFREDQLGRILAAKKTYRNGYCPIIVHATDIHADAVRLSRALDLADKIGADLFCLTGDITYNAPSERAYDYMHDAFAAHSVKPAICTGNHDANSTDDYSDTTIYQRMFEPSLDKLMTESEQSVAPGKPYYYTDLPVANLRVISVHLYEQGGRVGQRDYTHFTDIQLAWFVNVLASTPNGYGILVLMHSPQYNAAKVEGYDKFYMDEGWPYSDDHNDVSGDPIADIIQVFTERSTLNKTYTQKGTVTSVSVSADFTSVTPVEDNGPEFIAYLTGHYHQDKLGLTAKTDRVRRDDWQLNLNEICTTAVVPDTGVLRDAYDIPRSLDGSTQDCFNVYAIDRANKTVKIARVGSDQKYDFGMRDYMVIPYVEPEQ